MADPRGLRPAGAACFLSLSFAALALACTQQAEARTAPQPSAEPAIERTRAAPAWRAVERELAAAPQEPILKAMEGEPKLVSGSFNSARACGACHQEIFEKWERSQHSRSFLDPVFRAALYQAHYVSQGKAAPTCLRCHSPTALETKDFYGTKEITNEGVTCDYCHSVGALNTDALGVHYQLDFSAKHGPYPKSFSSAHPVAHRPYFEKSEVCAGCHDMVTADGTVVFSTYSEWKASKYAEQGRQCHDCHMQRVAGHSVKSGVGAKAHDTINDHQLLGGHEPSQVKRSVLVRVDSLARDAHRVRVVVALENAGAGHFVPTGIPSRKLVLQVTATQVGRTIFQRELVYQRVMQAADNRPLVEDWEIKLLSKRVLRDNRLAPGEVRHETLIFDASSSDDVEVEVKLTYLRGPVGGPSDRAVVISQFDQILPRGL